MQVIPFYYTISLRMVNNHLDDVAKVGSFVMFFEVSLDSHMVKK
jgi:hypothetical protein